jgi:hypothetical protein
VACLLADIDYQHFTEALCEGIKSCELFLQNVRVSFACLAPSCGDAPWRVRPVERAFPSDFNPADGLLYGG